MGKTSDKSYCLIARAVLDAAKRGQEPYVLWVSPKMVGRVQEVADMMGVKVEIRVGGKK